MSGQNALRVHLLGGFRAEVGGREIADERWRLRKARALVALLALAPGHRLLHEQLLDALWPDLSPSAGANQLRKTLHEARRVLDPDPAATSTYIASADDALRLAPAALTEVDVDAFERAALAARREKDPSAYEAAIERYGGELLPEFRYEDWVADRREALHAEHLALLVGQARLLEARADLDGAAAALHTVLAEDATNEDAASALMRVHALAGRRHDALAVYERLRGALADEVDAVPDVRTQRLFERIRAGLAEQPAGLTGELWEQVGDLRMLSGDAAGAAAAFGTAARLPGDDEAVPARRHRKAATAHLMGHHPAEAEPHLRAAETVVAHLDDEAEAGRIASARATWLYETGDMEGAQDRAEASLKAAERFGTGADVAAASETLAIVCHYRGAWREGLQLEIERFGATADTDAQLARIFDIHCCIGQYHLYGDGLSETVEAYARDTLDLAEARGARRAQAFAWCLLGEALLLQGRWDEAPGCLERSVELHSSLDSRSGVLPWQRLGELAAGRGDSARVSDCLHRGMALASAGTMARHAWGRLYATAAFDALERGAPDEALRAVRAAAVADERDGSCPSCSALLNPVAAEAFAALGDLDGAVTRAGAAAEVAGMFSSSAWSAMAETAQGARATAQEDPAAARTHFLAAARLYERAGQPFWSARSKVQAVSAVLDTRTATSTEDRALLDDAAVTFDRLGAVRPLAAVRALSA